MNSLPANVIASPCNGICQLDGNAICVGCFRTLPEIAAWTRLTADEQAAVIAAAQQRGRALAQPLKP